MATTTRRANRYPIGTDAADVPLWMQRLATDLDDHAKDNQGTLATRPAAGATGGKAGDYWQITDGTPVGILTRSDGTAWMQVTHRLVRVPHNFLVAGSVALPVGNADVIPAIFAAVKAGTTAKIVEIKDIAGSGSGTYKVQKNGVDIYTGEAITTTGGTTDVADNTLADGDRIQVIFTAVASLFNVTVAVIVEYSV